MRADDADGEVPVRRHVYGGGYHGDQGTFVASSFPIDSGDQGKKPDDGWRVSLDNTVSDEENHARVTATCGKAMPTYEHGDKGLIQNDRITRGVTCPDSKPNAIGGGQELTGNFGDNRVAQSRIVAFPTYESYEVSMDGFVPGFRGLTAWAVCGDPEDFG